MFERAGGAGAHMPGKLISRSDSDGAQLGFSTDWKQGSARVKVWSPGNLSALHSGALGY